MVLAPFKRAIKNSPRILGVYRWFGWRWHVLKDQWGSRVWTRTREIVTPQGFRLAIGSHPAYELMQKGTFEPEESALFTRMLANADAFVDIGANIGYYVALALQHGTPVIAFEPQPQNLRRLYQMLAANGWSDRVEVFPLALSDAPGLLTLYGASGPSASLVKGWAGYSSRFSQVVPVSTLDRILGERVDGRRLLVKIDVEGAEYGVLRGALKVLSGHPRPVWLVEACLSEFHPDGANPEFARIFQLFFDHGYAACTANAHLRPITPESVARWVEAGTTGTATFDYLFGDVAYIESLRAAAGR